MKQEVEQLNNQGVKFFLKGEFQNAKSKYGEALKISPNYTTALNNLGMVLLQEKEFKKAAEHFLKANREEENPTYLLNLGHAYANQGLIKEAEECYTKSIELDSSSLMAWKSLAALYQYQKRFNESVEVWSHIIEHISRDPEFKIQLGKDLISLGEYQNAAEVLYEASKYEKDIEITCYYLSLIHFHSKNFGLAKEAINKSIAKKPDYAEFRVLAASIYLGLSQLDNAIEQWDHVLRVDKNNHKVRIDKAVAMLAHGLKREALVELDYVITKIKTDSKALFYKALTLIEMNTKINEAVEILNTLRESDGIFSDRAKELLNELKHKYDL